LEAPRGCDLLIREEDGDPAERLRALEWEVVGPAAFEAHVHMAMDEVLLDRVIGGERRPTMRIWEWIEPALVIGSHQSVRNEIDLAEADRLGFTVTRWMSGGGTMLCEPARTITYSMYLPESAVAGISFRKSYALLDDWAVRAFVALGVPAGYREINDIISPRGKIAGAAQARRRGHVVHHTTIAHAMDPDLVPRLIRVGRERISALGVRSADKSVSPLSWFTAASCADVAHELRLFFARTYDARAGELSDEELTAARDLAASKYSTAAWVNRLP
jgi:lipoate---protein ligase